MAKKIIKTVEEPEEGNVLYALDKEQFQAIISETLKAQEASLNAMKRIAESMVAFKF